MTIDNEKGAYIATNYLIQNGLRDIILLSGPLSINTYMDRLLGYKKALTENDILFISEYVYQVANNDVSIEQGYNMLKDVIKSGKKFDGVFASNDLIAIGAIQALQEEGITIPDVVKIIGFDDIYPASLIKPDLTTISQPKYAMGCEAMNILYKLINSSKIKKREIIMEPKLKIS
ncbi:substrate-binding family protein [Thermohydrogenium kirishiense]|nr:substrate-binding family protein [Thermohydrogenium kirishiense]